MKRNSVISDRIFIAHEKQVFDPKKIRDLLFLINSYSSSNHFTLTDREKKLVEQGVLPDQARFDKNWYGIFDNVFANHSKIFFPFSMITFPVVVRNISDAQNHFVPWHQDFAYLQQLPPHKRHSQTLTCFVPLNKWPNKHTTLQFSNDNYNFPETLYAHENHLQNYGLGINEAFINKFSFELSSGDALLFGDHALHRTFSPKDAQIGRASLEFRLIKECDMLKDKDYFSLEYQKFVKL